MPKKLTFIVGVGGSARSEAWRGTARGLGTLAVSDRPSRDFWRELRLDIEILATSLVCVRLDLRPPVGGAASYRLNRPGEYAPIVVVPPVLDPANWPPELGGPAAAPSSKGTEDVASHARGYPAALYIWRKVLAEVAREVKELPQPHVMAGFHCDSIGYWGASEGDDVRAFENAYREFELTVAAASIHLSRPE